MAAAAADDINSEENSSDTSLDGSSDSPSEVETEAEDMEFGGDFNDALAESINRVAKRTQIVDKLRMNWAECLEVVCDRREIYTSSSRDLYQPIFQFTVMVARDVQRNYGGDDNFDGDRNDTARLSEDIDSLMRTFIDAVQANYGIVTNALLPPPSLRSMWRDILSNVLRNFMRYKGLPRHDLLRIFIITMSFLRDRVFPTSLRMMRERFINWKRPFGVGVRDMLYPEIPDFISPNATQRNEDDANAEMRRSLSQRGIAYSRRKRARGT